MVKNKGKFVVSFKKANKEYREYMSEQEDRELAKLRAESSNDQAKSDNEKYHTENRNTDKKED